MEALRKFFNSPAGKILAGIVVAIGLGLLVWVVKQNFGESDAAAISRERVFIDSTNMKPFNHDLKEGETIPCKAPSGGNTGYQAELCYWTKDGKTKEEPTPVLLNQFVNKPGPTFCPDCGRLVVGHNPAPQPGKRPPPTQEEYKQRGADKAPARM